jgi:hypothetical protein
MKVNIIPPPMIRYLYLSTTLVWDSVEGAVDLNGVKVDNQADGERVHVSIRGEGLLTERGVRGIKVLLDGLLVSGLWHRFKKARAMIRSEQPFDDLGSGARRDTDTWFDRIPT